MSSIRYLSFASFAWALSFAIPAHAATTLSRGPFLQQITDHGAQVVWRTTAAVACTLGYAPPNGPVQRVATAVSTEHVAVLGGLDPGTRYDYTIRSGAQLAGGPDYFLRTAPLAGSGATLRMLVWGDCGNGSATQSAVANVLDAQTADLGLVVGDIIYPSGQASYYDPRFFTPYAPLLRHTPVWAVIGNHDMGDLSAYLAAWHLPTNPIDGSERYYSFDFGDIHVVVLDSNQQFSPTILNWIATDLDASTRRWKMVAFHHTMYSCGNYHGSSQSLISTLGPVFDAHNVDLVLYGHDHDYERTYPMHANVPVNTAMDPNYTDPDGPIYVVSGGGGGARSVKTTCPFTAKIFATPSFVRLSLAGNVLTLEAIDSNAAVIDHMTLRKSGVPPPPVESIEITQPLGGETYPIGTDMNVRWISTAGVGPVRIELSRDGVAGPWETIAASTPNDGALTWTVTGPASPHCMLRVAAVAGGSPSDITDAGFGIEQPPDSGDPSTPSVIGINFQPASAPIPAGYVSDLGLPFDTGEGFGWNAPVTMRSRGVIPTDVRDTFADVVNNAPAAIWEIALPNGYYHATVVCGDPMTSATHRVALEGQVILQDVTTIGGQYVDKVDVPVLVSDGRLTMTVGGSGDITHTKVDAIVIVPGDPVQHTLTAPVGGENYCNGAAVPIRWTGSTAGALVRIDVSHTGPGGPWQTVAVSPDDGSETLAATTPASGNCWVRICNMDGTTLATSGAPFSISEPIIELVHPNGGEVWTTGTTRTFEWTSSCFAGNVRIDVSRSGAAGPWTTLVGNTANDGQESWMVRPEDIGWTHVRIVSLPFEIPQDQSDAAFAVVDPPSQPTASWRIDFLPTNGTLADGYQPDTGQAFDAGRGYGWNTASLTMKQRNLLPGDARDTFVQIVNNTTATWELAVPNGDYSVSLVCGDPFTSATHRVLLEGNTVVQDVYAVGGTFVTRNDLHVSVNDGKLTVKLGGIGNTTSTKLDCIQVVKVGALQSHPRPGAFQTTATWADRLDVPLGPLREATAFAIQLSRSAPLQLTIHDVRGRRVAVLHDGMLAAGPHTFAWSPRDSHGDRLPSGVYFLRAEGPTLQSTRKLIVIR